MSDRQKLFLIVGLVPITGAGVDVYAPCMPDLARLFAVEPALMRSSIGLYLAGYGIGQLFVGFLSDRFGRKPVLQGTLAAYIAVCCALAACTSIGPFLFLRFLHGLTVAGPGITTKALVSDSFRGPALAKASNWMTIGWASGPIIAPLVGSYAHTYWGWPSTFLLLAAFALFWLIYASIYLESASRGALPRVGESLAIAGGFLRSRPFWIGVLLLNGAYSMMTTFNALGPFLIVDTLGRSEVYFGFFSLAVGGAWLAGNVLSRVLLSSVTSDALLRAATVWGLVLFIPLFAATFAIELSPLAVAVPVLASLVWGGLVLPNAFAFVFRLFGTAGGVGNALAGGLFAFVTALVTSAASQLTSFDHRHLCAIHLVLIAASFFFLWRHRRAIAKGESPARP